MHIYLIAGTRPEYIKIAPVYRVFKQDPRWKTTLVVTGQHDIMMSQLYDFFGIIPDLDLRVMKTNQSLESLTTILLEKLTSLFKEIRPDYILAQGDTTTSFIASLAAFYVKIPIIHLEAGLRTDNKFSPFPEEINRRLTSVMADYHFCPSPLTEKNLHAENIREHVYIIGNTVIDSLVWALAEISENPVAYDVKFANLIKGYEKLILITAHRRESFGAGLKEIAQAIKTLALQNENFVFVFPLHLNPSVNSLMHEELGGIKNIKLLKPQNYDDMVYLMSKADLIMTDSGGIQEEAPTLKKRVLVMRDTTERPEAVEANFSILCGTSINDIINHFKKTVNLPTLVDAPNPYGEGVSAVKLKQTIDQIVFSPAL